MTALEPKEPLLSRASSIPTHPNAFTTPSVTPRKPKPPSPKPAPSSPTIPTCRSPRKT